MKRDTQQCINDIIDIIKSKVATYKLIDKYEDISNGDDDILIVSGFKKSIDFHLLEGLPLLAENLNLPLKEEDWAVDILKSKYYIDLEIEGINVQVFQLDKKGKYKTKQQKDKMIKQLKKQLEQLEAGY